MIAASSVAAKAVREAVVRELRINALQSTNERLRRDLRDSRHYARDLEARCDLLRERLHQLEDETQLED